jgi:hypothetical protein
MKIFGFESLMPAPGVEALVLKPQEVPLDAVLRDRLAGVDPTCGFDRFIQNGTSEPPARFGVPGKAGQVDWHTGFLVYIHDKDLADFIAGPFVPEGGSRLESQLSPCKSKKRRKELILEFLKRKRHPPSSMIWSKERRDLDAGLLGFAIRHRELQAFPLTLRKNGLSYFGNAHDGCSVVAERKVCYGGFDIPRLVRAWTGPNINPEGASWFDGESIGFAETLDQLPPALFRELDEHGRFDDHESRQPLPYPPIKRIPRSSPWHFCEFPAEMRSGEGRRRHLDVHSIDPSISSTRKSPFRYLRGFR